MLKSIELKGTTVTSDKFGCAYVVSGGSQLIKVCNDSSNKRTYSLLRYGPITSVDATNPFKILVFYKDFSTVVLLDNTLSEQGRVNLQNLGILQPSAMCLSMDNNIWVYDEQEYKLKKINDSGQMLNESEDFTIMFPEPSKPNFMVQKDNLLLVNDPQNGIRVFDIYGAYSKTIPLKGLSKFQFVKNQIIYFKDGKLYSFHTLTFETKQIALPDGLNIQDVNVQSGLLLVLGDSQLNIYGYE